MRPHHDSRTARKLAPLLVAALLSGLLSLPVCAQPDFSSDEIVLYERSHLTTPYDILALDDGYAFVLASSETPGLTELMVERWDAELETGTTLGTLPASSPTGAYLLDALDVGQEEGVVALWREQLLSSPYRFAGRHVSTTGPPGEVFELTHEPWVPGRGVVTTLEAGIHAGRHLAIWRPQVPEGEDPPIVQRRLFDRGGAVGTLADPLSTVPAGLSDLAVAPSGNGGFLLVWSQRTSAGGTRVFARIFDQAPGGDFLPGPLHQVAETPRQVLAWPAVITNRDGSFQVVWRSVDSVARETLLTRRLTPRGTPQGSAMPLSNEGLIPFIGRPALARGPLGTIWVVWTEGPLGQRQVVARLIDRNGMPRTEAILLGETFTGPVADAKVVLGIDGQALVTWIHDRSRLVGRRLSEFPDGACIPGPTTLCLGQGRFKVEVSWTDHEGTDGEGQDTGLGTPESGLFWFFHPDNWELLVKVIDGCSFNGHHWVFAAATTDVATTLTVTDTLSGEMRTYTNPIGQAAPAINDATAFAGCDRGPR